MNDRQVRRPVEWREPVQSSVVCAIAVTFALAGAAYAGDEWPTSGWKNVAPAEVGLDAVTIGALDKEIASGKFGAVDSMLVIRRGKIAYERHYAPRDPSAGEKPSPEKQALVIHNPSGPYNYLNPWWHPFFRGGELHTMQSVTKTIASATIGAAIARGEFPDVDTPILRFFDGWNVANADARKRAITIRHLLTMTAGLEWREDNTFSDPANSAHAMESTCDWERYAIDRPMQHDPGKVFHYSSGSSQLLAHIFERSTGSDLEQYAARHLFAPLGIREFQWKRTPNGTVNVEGGLYLRPRDLAKVGYLFLKDGVWEGKAVVRPEWVRQSVTPVATVSEETQVKYGYQWWLLPYGEGNGLAWMAAGWGGQLLIVVPEAELIVVFTGWNIDPEKPALRASAGLARVLASIKPSGE